MPSPTATEPERPLASTGSPRPPTNTCSILAIVFAFLCWPAGLILGHIAHRQIARTGENGRGMATAAITIGYVCLALTGFVMIVAVVAAGHAHMALGAA